VSGALLILLCKYDELAVWTSAEKDESKDRYLLRSDGSFDLNQHKVSIAAFTSRDEKWLYEGREKAGKEKGSVGFF